MIEISSKYFTHFINGYVFSIKIRRLYLLQLTDESFSKKLTDENYSTNYLVNAECDKYIFIIIYLFIN